MVQYKAGFKIVDENFKSVFVSVMSLSNKNLFAFENAPSLGNKSGLF
jgi:hypothetical protein